MVQSLTRPTKGLFEGKRWPFYRGCRAGKQFKERESFKRHGITSIEIYVCTGITTLGSNEDSSQFLKLTVASRVL